MVCARFSADGKQVVTGSLDKTARVWDAVTGQPLTEPLAHGSEVYSAQFSPDGLRIVTVVRDKTVRVWDLASGKLLDTFPDDDEVRGVAFAADGRAVYFAGKTLRVWSFSEGNNE